MTFSLRLEPPAPLPSSAWLHREVERLLVTARAARAEEGGFWWLDDAGRPDRTQTRQLWITNRMTHVFSIGALLGFPGAAEMADHGVASLLGAFHDDEHGGWFAELGPKGPLAGPKGAYGHAFVLLAASSARVAGRPGADELWDRIVKVVEERFWDDEAGALVEEWDRSFTTLDPYRGANANMHGIESFLAAGDASDDDVWRQRALRIAERIVDREARERSWRLAEHFDEAWTALPDYNRDEPAHPFRPYGVTPGHGLEWARLMLHLDAALAEPPAWLRESAVGLFDRAVADGWFPATGGFAYTTDWEGVPVVEQRFHWVVCEGIAASAALFRATGEQRYADWYAKQWAYARRSYLTGAPGWLHEVDERGEASSVTWSGRPDVYHALQAALISQLPLKPMITRAVKEAVGAPTA